MEALAGLADGAAAQRALGPSVKQYRDWIEDLKKVRPSLSANRREMADALFQRATMAANRIEEGINVLDDKDVMLAFRVANRVMARAARRRFGTMQGRDGASVETPAWRPFQLAFILMNLSGIANPPPPRPRSGRPTLFPDGRRQDGGVSRPGRLHSRLSPLEESGLRLAGAERADALHAPAADARPAQSRAATLICALELERHKDPDTLGPLAVRDRPLGRQGRHAEPHGRQGRDQPELGPVEDIAFQNDDRKPPRSRSRTVPGAARSSSQHSFQLVPNAR